MSTLCLFKMALVAADVGKLPSAAPAIFVHGNWRCNIENIRACNLSRCSALRETACQTAGRLRPGFSTTKTRASYTPLRKSCEKETGLLATYIGQPVGWENHFTDKSWKEMCRLIFVVETKGAEERPEVRVDAYQHQQIAWARRDNIKAKPTDDLTLLKFTTQDLENTVLVPISHIYWRRKTSTQGNSSPEPLPPNERSASEDFGRLPSNNLQTLLRKLPLSVISIALPSLSSWT